jgi:predicted nucleic acid-binding protein
MSAERATYVDSSALVKLAVREPESAALRRYLGRRRPLVSSALARTEVVRALLPLGPDAVRRGREVLARVGLLRVNDRILDAAGLLPPAELRTLDAIHLASAEQLGSDLRSFVTYDDRLATAATSRGFRVMRPA